MNKLQYDSFYKFMVSIGTLLIASPILGAYYILTNSPNVLISEQEYSDLSEFSRYALYNREAIIDMMPYVLLGLFVLGLFCAVWGGIKWYNIQRTLDKGVELDVKEKSFKYDTLTASEVAEKVAKETIETQEADDTAPLRSQNQRMFKSLQKALQAEDAYIAYLNKKQSKGFEIKPNIKMGGYQYDIVAISKHDNIDYIYEIKYWPNESAAGRAGDVLRRLSESGVNYENSVGRNLRTKLIVVSEKEHIAPIKKRLERYLSNVSNGTYSSVEIEYFYFHENKLIKFC